MATLKQHQDVVLARLNTTLSPKVAYSVDKVPTTRPPEYVEVLVSEIFTAPDELLMDATTDVRRYRITVWWLSQTSVANALVSREKCFSALRFARLSVAGEDFPPAQFEGTEDEVSYVNGWFVGSADFTY